MNALVDKIYRTMRKLGIFDLIPDEPYLKLMYRLKMGKPLNLDNPTSYNEKMQWLKLYNRKPEYTQMVDKYTAKAFIAEKVGAEYTIPLLGVWDRFQDIDFSALPERFVLKTTHDSGGVCICRCRKAFDPAAAKEKLEKSLAADYYKLYREWPYKNVVHRIIAEEYLEDDEAGALVDYKLHMFHGEPKLFAVISQRGTGCPKADYFDADFHPLDIDWSYPHAEKLPPKPSHLADMKSLAAKLAEGVPYVRVDFYEVNGKVYVGELTFFDDSGFSLIKPESWNQKMGRWIALPEKSKAE